MSETALKPCPFCGGEAAVMETWAYGYAEKHVQCKKCDISTPSVPFRQKGTAVRKWNRRVGEMDKEASA